MTGIETVQRTLSGVAVFSIVLGLGSLGAQEVREDLRRRTQLDAGTGARLSLARKISTSIMTRERREVDACVAADLSEIAVVVDVPNNIDLSDNALAAQLVEKGKEYAVAQCRKPNEDITVRLYQTAFDSENWRDVWTVYARYHWVFSFDPKKREYTNKALARAEEIRRREEEQRRGEEERRRREAEEHQTRETSSREFITRSIEGFALGMKFDEALGLLVRGVREKRFVLLEHEFSWERFMRQALDPLSKEFKEKMTSKAWWTLDSGKRRAVPRVFTGQWPLEVVSLRPFRSASVASIVVRLYGSRVFAIEMEPMVAEDIMRRALAEKYGQPLQAEKWKDVWEDARSMLFYEIFAGGHRLTYQDKAALRAMREEIDRREREAEEERRRQEEKKRTVPKQF